MATWLNVEAVGPRYFATLEIPIARGRAFSEADRDGVERVVIVSEAVARHFWPGADPIGQGIEGPFIGKAGDFARVVGVVPDTRYRDLRAPKPTIYFPHRQFVTAQPFIVVRTKGDPSALVAPARSVIASVRSDMLMWRARTMDELAGVPLQQPRLSTSLLVAFGLSALLLAGFGLYAVTATAVRSRTRELAIRIALGASPNELRAMVLRQATRVVAFGVVAGLLGAIATSRFVQALVFETSPNDPLSLAAVVFVLMLVSLVAASIPARRSARVDPVQAFREQ
jgi:hypothetical protein